MEFNNLSSKGFQKKAVKSFQCDKKTVKGSKFTWYTAKSCPICSHPGVRSPHQDR